MKIMPKFLMGNKLIKLKEKHTKINFVLYDISKE